MFYTNIENCRECGGVVKVIACIEYPVVIEKILAHLQERGARIPPICGRKAERHRLTCLADLIKSFTSFQWRLPKGQPGCRLA